MAADTAVVDASVIILVGAPVPRYLVTANARDFERHLGEMGSEVEVLDVAAPRKKGQLRLIDQ